jgi:hypothetical protein
VLISAQIGKHMQHDASPCGFAAADHNRGYLLIDCFFGDYAGLEFGIIAVFSMARRIRTIGWIEFL